MLKFKSLIRAYHLLRKTKVSFLPPPKKKNAILDLIGSPEVFLKKFFNSSDYIRIQALTDECNIFFVLLTLLRFNFSQRMYYAVIVDYYRPKYVLSFSGDPGFLCIKPLTKHQCSFIYMEASAYNCMDTKCMGLLQDSSKPKACDYLLPFSKARGEFLKTFLQGNTTIEPIGSLRSLNIAKSPTKNNTISFISQVMNPQSNHLPASTKEIVDWEECYTSNLYIAEQYVVRYLYNFCKQHNLYFQILGRHTKLQKEELSFFQQILDHDDFVFLANDKPYNSYIEAFKSNVVVSIDSTLGLECFSRGVKTAFFAVRGEIQKIKNNIFFGWPNGLTSQSFNYGGGAEKDHSLLTLAKILTRLWILFFNVIIKLGNHWYHNIKISQCFMTQITKPLFHSVKIWGFH